MGKSRFVKKNIEMEGITFYLKWLFQIIVNIHGTSTIVDFILVLEYIIEFKIKRFKKLFPLFVKLVLSLENA